MKNNMLAKTFLVVSVFSISFGIYQTVENYQLKKALLETQQQTTSLTEQLRVMKENEVQNAERSKRIFEEAKAELAEVKKRAVKKQ